MHFEKLVVFEIECDAGGRIFCWASSCWKHSFAQTPGFEVSLAGQQTTCTTHSTAAIFWMKRKREVIPLLPNLNKPDAICPKMQLQY